MSGAGVLIVFAVLGAVICAKSRVPGGAVVFSLLALGLFVTTPIGAGLPGMLSDVVSVVGRASASLTGQSGAVG
ncbi:MAG: hypothetical protein L0K86_00695 [Actinomycetia bacterium]|nr:hypothetical protein [Actinomycetes bacterium]